MKPDHIFGQTFSCECGKTHRIEPGKIVYSDDAFAQLPTTAEELDMGSRVAVLMDTRTRSIAGRELSEGLANEGLDITDAVVRDRPDGGWPICDDTTKNKLEGQIGRVDWILTVGSGVITDLGKWLAADRDIPFICFATAASMNGYASANVAPTIGGVKTLLRGRPPIAALSDAKILMDAPYEMTSAGLGDVLAKSASTADWYMNHLLFGEYYCAKSAGLISDIEPLYLLHPEDIRALDPGAIEALFQALLLTGASMTMAESSAPSSGGEHMISHTLDMMSTIDGEAHDLHGRQVGIGTILATELYKRVLSIESPTFLEPLEISDENFWGPHGKAIKKTYSEKIPRLRGIKEKLTSGEAWDRFRHELGSMLHPPETIHQCLTSAGAATKAEDIQCSPARLSEAFRHAYELRSRFTILDLANLVGIMPGAADEIVSTWAIDD